MHTAAVVAAPAAAAPGPAPAYVRQQSCTGMTHALDTVAQQQRAAAQRKTAVQPHTTNKKLLRPSGASLVFFVKKMF